MFKSKSRSKKSVCPWETTPHMHYNISMFSQLLNTSQNPSIFFTSLHHDEHLVVYFFLS